MSNFHFSLGNDPKGGPLDDFFPFSHTLLILIKTSYLYTQTHFGAVHGLHQPNQYLVRFQFFFVAVCVVIILLMLCFPFPYVCVCVDQLLCIP